MKEQEKVIVIDKLRHKYSLRELLKLAEMARSTFYYYLKKYKSNHDKYHKIKKKYLIYLMKIRVVMDIEE